MEDTMLELVKICQEKEFLCIHDDVDDLIESALNSKLLLINSNSQRLEKKEQEVKNVVEQPAERGNRSIQSLQNFRVVHKNIENVEASLPNPEIVSVEEENDVEEENVIQQEEEEIDLEDISQIQDIVLQETRSGNTTHANNSLLEYDSFCFEIEPDQERLINLVKNNIPDDPSNNSLLEEADLFLSDNLIPLGIENVADDPEGDIRFLEELLINDSILSHESSDYNFEDNPSIPRPHPKPPDAETDAGEEIPVVMNDKDKDVDYSYFMFVIFDKKFSLLSAESDDTIFDP
nr:hypothetical protein [Tanacetum cinerariifolium]